MDDRKVKVLNTYQLKKLTNNSLAQFIALVKIDDNLAQEYFNRTSYEHPKLGRIYYAENTGLYDGGYRYMIMRIAHGYGYDLETDIINSFNY